MFTPITECTDAQQAEILASLDAPPEWEATWDIGLVAAGDSFSVRPIWGAWEVDGRWPAAFPLGRDHHIRPWRHVCDAHPGYSRAHHGLSFGLEQVGVSFRH